MLSTASRMANRGCQPVGTDLRRVEVDERVVADPAAVAAGVFELRGRRRARSRSIRPIRVTVQNPSTPRLNTSNGVGRVDLGEPPLRHSRSRACSSCAACRRPGSAGGVGSSRRGCGRNRSRGRASSAGRARRRSGTPSRRDAGLGVRRDVALGRRLRRAVERRLHRERCVLRRRDHRALAVHRAGRGEQQPGDLGDVARPRARCGWR